jgi:ribosome-associated protein
MDADKKLDLIVAACEDKKALDLEVLDLRGRTLIADYFVICSGTSKIHCRAIADGLLETMKKNGIKGVRSEGYEQGTWILLDYADVVAHIFAQEEREYYQLEDLWKRSARTEAEAEAPLPDAPVLETPAMTGTSAT